MFKTGSTTSDVRTVLDFGQAIYSVTTPDPEGTRLEI